MARVTINMIAEKAGVSRGTVDRVRKGKDGSIEIYPAMGLSLTYDHRAVDGTPAARFQKELGYNLEHFTTLLAK